MSSNPATTPVPTPLACCGKNERSAPSVGADSEPEKESETDKEQDPTGSTPPPMYMVVFEKVWQFIIELVYTIFTYMTKSFFPPAADARQVAGQVAGQVSNPQTEKEHIEEPTELMVQITVPLSVASSVAKMDEMKRIIGTRGPRLQRT